MTALWRPPSLRRDTTEARHSAVSWTELFYDLVFVVAVAALGRRFLVSHGGVEYAALFGMLWWAWASITFLVDRYESNDGVERLLAVFQMLGIAGFAAAVARQGDLDDVSAAIAASYTLTRLSLLALYARAWWHIEASRDLVSGYLRGFGADTALWAVSIFAPVPYRYALWAAAMLVSLATPWLMRRVQARRPLNVSHLPERFGLFTILVLGEPVAAVVAALGIEEAHIASLGAALAAFVVATGLWWVFFDNHEGSIVRRDPERVHDWRPTVWIYSHFPLAAAVAALGHGMAELVAGHGAETEVLRVVCGLGLAVALLAMAGILLCAAGNDPSRRRRRAAARVVGAVAAVAIAALARDPGPAGLLAALAAVVAGEVAFDVVDEVRRPA